jgi:hypothetical protein
VIPRSIKELTKDWADESSLREVIFESALSLRVMIETDKVELNQSFYIKFIERDCKLVFRGYSVETVSGANDLFRITKRFSESDSSISPCDRPPENEAHEDEQNVGDEETSAHGRIEQGGVLYMEVDRDNVHMCNVA